MKASQLRDLTRRYASGGIAREAYLAERKRLIDAVTSGEETLKYRELDPPTPSGTASKPSRTRTMVAGAALLLVLTVAFATHFLSNDEDPVENTNVAAAQEEISEVILLLEGFNENDDWSDEALETLENRWQEFADTEREDARTSLPYRRLQREVETRIKEHEALVAAGGDPEALMRAARLRMFSEKLGFEQ